jgi:hypothetical protein
MLTRGQATVAGSLEEADMRKDEALSLVIEFGEGIITKIAEYGVDLEEYGPLVNGFVAYNKLGLKGVNELMDIAIKIVEPDAISELMKITDLSKFMEIPK